MRRSDLPAKNDYTVCLGYRGAWFAGKPRSYGIWHRQGYAFEQFGEFAQGADLIIAALQFSQPHQCLAPIPIPPPLPIPPRTHQQHSSHQHRQQHPPAPRLRRSQVPLMMFSTATEAQAQLRAELGKLGGGRR